MPQNGIAKNVGHGDISPASCQTISTTIQHARMHQTKKQSELEVVVVAKRSTTL